MLKHEKVGISSVGLTAYFLFAILLEVPAFERRKKMSGEILQGDSPPQRHIFAYVLACGGPKIRREFTRIFDARFGQESYFWLPELGGVKDLIDPDTAGDNRRLLRKMRKALEVHTFGLVVLVNHSNCGVYRLAGHTFPDPQTEERFHAEQLKVAEDITRKNFPKIAVEIHYFLKAEQRMAW